jgi:hypothetical protein
MNEHRRAFVQRKHYDIATHTVLLGAFELPSNSFAAGLIERIIAQAPTFSVLGGSPRRYRAQMAS